MYQQPQQTQPVGYNPVYPAAPMQYQPPPVQMPYSQPSLYAPAVAYPAPYGVGGLAQAQAPYEAPILDERGHQPSKVFQLQQNFGSPTGNMTVKDEAGRTVCLFKGKWVSALDCVLIKDPNSKRTIGKVSEKVTTKKLINRPRYTIEAAGLKATMSKDVLALLKDNFTIRLRYPNGQKSEIHVKSNWFSWEFKFYLNGQIIAAVSKRFVHLTDTYGVAVFPNNPLDAALLLGCAVVIDRVCFGELTLKGFFNTASHLPQNPFSRFPVSHASW